MAYKMLGHSGLRLVSGAEYFSSYPDSLWQLYVLVTTANHPDIMMPAFNEHVAYVVFFAGFLVLCYFIYMNIVLAVVYSNYKRHLKDEVVQSFVRQQTQLQRAFDLLCHPASSTREAWVCGRRFRVLLAALPGRRRTAALVAVLFSVLRAPRQPARIERDQFLRLAELLSVSVSEVSPPSSCLRYATIRLPRLFAALGALVNSRWFQHFFDGLTVVNAVVIGCSDEDSAWDAPLEWVFLTAFLVEIALKLASLGCRRFFRRSWNTFDFIVIGSAFVIGVAEVILDEQRESRVILDVLLVVRVLRLVRLAGSVRSFQLIVLTLGKIMPSLATYGALIMMFYYIFAIVGMEIFSGLISASSPNDNTTLYNGHNDNYYNGHHINDNTNHNNDHHTNHNNDYNLNSNGNASKTMFAEFCGNPRLAGTEFWRLRYCNNNFNDILHAFIVLFELTVVNQWHVLADGFTAVTHSSARIFFLLFHALAVTLLLNVFTAFVLEVFLLEYCAASDGVMETQLEAAITSRGLSETRRRRRSSTISHEELVMQDSSEDEDAYDPPTKPAYQPYKQNLADSGLTVNQQKDKQMSVVDDRVSPQSFVGFSDNKVPADGLMDVEAGMREKATDTNKEGEGGKMQSLQELHDTPADSTGTDEQQKEKTEENEQDNNAVRGGCEFCKNDDDDDFMNSFNPTLDTTVRFHLSKRALTAEALLQKLFQQELQQQAAAAAAMTTDHRNAVAAGGQF